MSAELLRKAAAKIRENAEAATPGPWRAFTTGARGGDHWYICDSGEAIAHISAQDGINEEQRCGDACHIASWHPVVALAVADWLDDVAERVDGMSHPTYCDASADNAVSVALAYLGDDS